jgi:hypothetical protein
MGGGLSEAAMTELDDNMRIHIARVEVRIGKNLAILVI